MDAMTASAYVVPRVSASCQCLTCGRPTDENAGERALHTLRHNSFAEWLHPPTDAERGQWANLRRLAAFEAETVATGVCRLPHHQMLPRHPAHH